MLDRLRATLARPVDGASLAVMRIAVGAVVFLEAVRLVTPRSGVALLRVYYVDAAYLFPFRGFEWVRPWPEPVMTALVVALALAGLTLAVGILPRFSAAVCAALWSYIVLLDAARFNNHYYLEALLAAQLAFMPSGRRFAPRFPRATRPQPLVPFWTVFLLRIQWAVVYFWAGVAKLSPEWLGFAEPIQTILLDPTTKLRAMETFPDAWVHGAWPYLSSAPAAYALSYAGAAFDLAAGPLLVLRRTRFLGLALTLLFHATNHWLLFGDIGYFPILGAVGACIFLPPDWPLRLNDWARRPFWTPPNWGWLAAGALLVPGLGALLGWKSRGSLPPNGGAAKLSTSAAALILGWAALQSLYPALQFLPPEPIVWSGKADQFFWRMKSAVKIATQAEIVVQDPEVPAADDERLEWNAWPGERILYVHVDPSHVDWKALPEILVEFQPIHGERVLYNPFAGRGGLGLASDEARDRVRKLWLEKFGRQPRIVPTELLSRAIESARLRLARGSASPDVLRRLELSQDAARRVERGGAGLELEGLLDSVRRELVELGLRSGPEVGAVVRLAMRYVHPMALLEPSGARGAFFVVDDPQLVEGEGRRYAPPFAAVRPEATVVGADEPLRVFASLHRLSPAELRCVPRERLERSESGEVRILWNPYAELEEGQAAVAFVQPFLCWRYAGRVAREWQARTGRTPRVRFAVDMAVAPYRAQPLISDGVDLAAEQWSFFRSLRWLGPFLREAAAPRFEASEAATGAGGDGDGARRRSPPRRMMR
jgi:hypothetical protein